jgi:hypothetical protein
MKEITQGGMLSILNPLLEEDCDKKKRRLLKVSMKVA